MAQSPAPVNLVLIGTGLGVYTLATAFHAQYGIRARVVTKTAVEAMRSSVACDVVELGRGASDDDMLTALEAQHQELTTASPGVPVLLLCNNDGVVEFISRNRERLAPLFELTVPPASTLERIVDKAEFFELCMDLDVPTPHTEIVDFAVAGAIAPSEIPFPVVAKAAKGSDLSGLSIAGKKKVYFLQNQEELDAVWAAHRAAGYTGRYVVQELIPGDDTATWSITAYRDREGRVTLRASARVLLGEHTPDALGRPAAMMTIEDTDALDGAERILHAIDYRGFANFDLKRDPRDGILKFFELNPRIGRNNPYVTAAGSNVAQFPVQDVLGIEPPLEVTVQKSALYSLVPMPLLRRYVTDPVLWRQVKSVARSGIANPWDYRPDGLRARAYAAMVKLNHVRKFMRHYPKPTETGF